MIPPDTIAKILDAAQIADVVGDFVSLKRRGSDFVACCPFHNEKTPSFHVSPTKGYFKCFGCGESGSAVGFLMKHESMTYPEALRYLAKRYGIEITERAETAEDIATRTRRESLLLVAEFAHKFYVESLDTEEGRSIAMAYYHSRGLEDLTIQKYGLGWAPKSRHAFYDAAMAKGFKEEYLLDLGLCVKYDDGRVVDKFFERVMFPVHSHTGQVLGFGGRTLLNDKTVAKYVNSSQSDIYDKSSTLYGINYAKNSISREDRCYLVEGYLDVLSMHQLGICNVIASSGTSLTSPQIRLMRKFTENVTIMYDGDSAGIKAALRGINLVLKEGMKVKIVLLPESEDPDSFSRKHSLDEVRQYISEQEQDFIEFKTDLLMGEAGNDPQKRAELIIDIADTIAVIPDAVTRSVYCQTISSKFNIDSSIIFSRINSKRMKMLEDEKKAMSRSESYAQDQRMMDVEGVADEYESISDQELREIKAVSSNIGRNSILLPGEEELLYFILKYGLCEMAFETDSIYYDSENIPTVAAFISCNLEAEGLIFQNEAHRRCYDIYFDYYDNHPEMNQDAIVMAMINGPDIDVSRLVIDITAEKYSLTVKDFRASMTATSTKLVKFVPRSFMAYQLAVAKWRGMELKERLKTAPEEEMMSILAELKSVSEQRKKLDEVLGRVR